MNYGESDLPPGAHNHNAAHSLTVLIREQRTVILTSMDFMSAISEKGMKQQKRVSTDMTK
jgi:hypothetical protein